MLIQITNTCNELCPHCMQRSSSKPQHMTLELAQKAKDFAIASDTFVVMISGGEPTLHPHFREIVEMFADVIPQVGIASNGTFITNHAKTEEMRTLLHRPNVILQITSIPTLYRDYALIMEHKEELLSLGRVAIEEGPIHLKALGRCTDSPTLSENAKQDPSTMSCLSSCLIAAQLPYHQAMVQMQFAGKFCHPLVDWKGFLHWSESWLCPHFAHITEPLADISQKAHDWRPCGCCADYDKYRNNQGENYCKARKILGVKEKESISHVTHPL